MTNANATMPPLPHGAAQIPAGGGQVTETCSQLFPGLLPSVGCDSPQRQTLRSIQHLQKALQTTLCFPSLHFCTGHMNWFPVWAELTNERTAKGLNVKMQSCNWDAFKKNHLLESTGEQICPNSDSRHN